MDLYLIIYSLISILLVYIIFKILDCNQNNGCLWRKMANKIVINDASKTCNCLKDTFITLENNKSETSPEYSHTVDLPINNPISCQNFCGPTNKCVKTGEQCLADIDCFGCGLKQPVTDIYMAETSGKLGPTLSYSKLTNGYDNHMTDFAEATPGSYTAEIGQIYSGKDKWQKDFNQGLALYNKWQDAQYNKSMYNDDSMKPAYPMHLSMTGLFYETTPLPGNVPTNM